MVFHASHLHFNPFCLPSKGFIASLSSVDLNQLFEKPDEERLKLFPLEATANGDSRYNDHLTISFTNSFRGTG
jgi:hypothetical protein